MVRNRDAVLTVAALVVAAVLGLGIGLSAAPEAASPLLVVFLLQLIVSVLALPAERHPALWAVAICLCSVSVPVAGQPLIELLRQGGVPWITVALALGSQNLFRRVRTPVDYAVGVLSLVVAVGTVVVVSAAVDRGGLVQAALAATTPLLAGALIATSMRLADARKDRLAGVPQLATPAPLPAGVHRALTLVTLRADALLALAPDDRTRDAARDLRTVAIQGLVGGSETGVADSVDSSVNVAVAVQLRIAETEGDKVERVVQEERVVQKERVSLAPELGDKEREILRLVATGASNADIARQLYLSEATVKGYVSRLMRRFEHKNRTQLALMASRWFT